MAKKSPSVSLVGSQVSNGNGAVNSDSYPHLSNIGIESESTSSGGNPKRKYHPFSVIVDGRLEKWYVVGYEQPKEQKASPVVNKGSNGAAAPDIDAIVAAAVAAVMAQMAK